MKKKFKRKKRKPLVFSGAYIGINVHNGRIDINNEFKYICIPSLRSENSIKILN